MARRGSAAGKLMVGGEYAVLTGQCRSLAAAVGSLARWSLDEGEGVSLAAFGSEWRWSEASGAPQGIGQLVQRCLSDAAAHGFGLIGHLSLEVDGEVAGTKVGLGTSAATVVATMAACAASSPQNVPAALVHERAHATHRASQGGKGSGYDVGTVLTGGCALYDRPTETTTRLAWPAGLHAAALFTGASASTVKAIAKPLSAAAIAGISGATNDLIDAWQRADSAHILAALRACEAAFDRAAKERPWLLPPHVDEVRQVIFDHGCQPRVSGAGGGDCILAFSDTEGDLAALLRHWRAAGRVVVAELPAGLSNGASMAPEAS